MKFTNHKPVRVLILLMIILTGLGILISKSYYRRQNQSVDPRVVTARQLYQKYNQYAALNQFDSVFYLMDTIEALYTQYPHYRNSYETGVLYNNRAAAYLTMILADEEKSRNYTDSLLVLAGNAVRTSIDIYQQWIEKYSGLSRAALRSMILNDFAVGLDTGNNISLDVYIEKRLDEMEEAIVETPRRLSVSYTNLGLVARQQQEYEKAARSYAKALELWDRNLTAENNLNILLGRPLKKRNIIQKLFPPERIDE